ncbi:hypothetical protein, partial [Salmonella sp. s51228]|uniref:hypothetical protein n=1 Tax=Salmonella sp. s51228 TaxID=3159652 RepID=UPI00398099F9
RAEAARIEGTASVDHARLKSQASKIDSESELERLTLAREAELKFLKEQNEIEIHKTRDMSSIESEKFKNMVDTVGSDTIRAIATAGPEMQVKLLQALGLKTTLITDGSRLKSQASKIDSESELERLTLAREAELKFLK